MRTLALLALAATAAFAQTGSLSGTVVDPDGQPVAQASVVLSRPGAPALNATTTPDGKFNLASIPAGLWELAVSSRTMVTVRQKDVRIEAGQAAVLAITQPFNTQMGTLGEDRLAAAFNASLHKPPTGPTPRAKDGHPDLSGVWWTPQTVDPGKPEFLASANAVAAQRQAQNGKDNPQARCLPSAVVRLGPLFQFVQSQDFMIRISDDDSPGFYQIYLDGRAHPADPNPAWYGHNIGKWDGDTLVVDRVGFHEGVWLDQDMHPHTDKLHVVERYRRPDLGHLEIETTVEDPGILSKPWTQKRVADLAAGHEIYEFICPENNRDLEHMVGK